MLLFALCLAIGVLAGVLGGIFGLGGGIIIVPALVAIGLTQRQASATSLCALVLPVGIFGVIEYAKHGDVQWLQGGGIALGLLAGVFVGAKLGIQASEVVLQRTFGIILLLIGVRFIIWAK